MSEKITSAWIMQVAYDNRTYNGVHWYEQGLVKDIQILNGSAIGVVEEGGSLEIKVWVGLIDGALSFDCEDCFIPDDPFADEDKSTEPEPRLCAHAAAVAMAATEQGIAWRESLGPKGLRSI